MNDLHRVKNLWFEFKCINSALVKSVIGILMLMLCADVSAAELNLSGSRPNIIFVLTDDQGMGDLSGQGNTILRTPNIDAFAEQSKRFTDFQVSPTCAPSRAAIMSGRRPFEVGVTHTIKQRERMALDVITFPQVLQSAGYTTGLFGKWHLGDESAYLPQNRGFDEVLMLGGGGIGQYKYGDFKANLDNPYFDNVLLHNDTIVKTKGFCTDVFFDSALAWVNKQRKTNKPFFAYIPLNAPHGPMYAPESYKRRFLEQGYDETTAARYGMIENVDDNMGRMMKMLGDWKLLDKTLVIFMTDNGMSMAPINKSGEMIYPFNAGMKGRKNSPWEGGTHVPSFWYWKGVLTPAEDINSLAAHIDLYRTFVDLAGAKIPDSKLPPNGYSLVPLLENAETKWVDRKLFIHKGRWGDGIKSQIKRDESKYAGAAVRTEKWRLVMSLVSNKVEYFLSDITVDPGETSNLANMYPEIVKELSAAYDQWWDSTEKYLVNEKRPAVTPEMQPMSIKYQQQLKSKGIPNWAPDI